MLILVGFLYADRISYVSQDVSSDILEVLVLQEGVDPGRTLVGIW